MLKRLAKRATLLKSGKFEKVAEVEAEMTRIKNENFLTLITPVTLFVTFETEEATIAALKLGEIELEDRKIPIESAPDPENIIWENREISSGSSTLRWWIIFLVMSVISIVIFTCFV